jgi:hypothetical protein
MLEAVRVNNYVVLALRVLAERNKELAPQIISGLFEAARETSHYIL